MIDPRRRGVCNNTTKYHLVKEPDYSKAITIREGSIVLYNGIERMVSKVIVTLSYPGCPMLAGQRKVISLDLGPPDSNVPYSCVKIVKY